MKFNIELTGDTGKVHNVRFTGDKHASNEVLLGIFYEDVKGILDDIELIEQNNFSSESQNNYSFGDFISGKLNKKFSYITPDNEHINSKSYKVDTEELKRALFKWIQFKSKNRNGVVKIVTISGEYVGDS